MQKGYINANIIIMLKVLGIREHRHSILRASFFSLPGIIRIPVLLKYITLGVGCKEITYHS